MWMWTSWTTSAEGGEDEEAPELFDADFQPMDVLQLMRDREQGGAEQPFDVLSARQARGRGAAEVRVFVRVQMNPVALLQRLGIWVQGRGGAHRQALRPGKISASDNTIIAVSKCTGFRGRLRRTDWNECTASDVQVLGYTSSEEYRVPGFDMSAGRRGAQTWK